MSLSLTTEPIVFPVIDPANIPSPAPQPLALPFDPEASPAYFTFNENNQPFVEAPNFAPIAIEPVE